MASIGNGLMIGGIAALAVGTMVVLFAVENRPGVGLPVR